MEEKSQITGCQYSHLLRIAVEFSANVYLFILKQVH
jgi:hypothetical protein